MMMEGEAGEGGEEQAVFMLEKWKPRWWDSLFG